jgi:hypothetical protein
VPEAVVGAAVVVEGEVEAAELAPVVAVRAAVAAGLVLRWVDVRAAVERGQEVAHRGPARLGPHRDLAEVRRGLAPDRDRRFLTGPIGQHRVLVVVLSGLPWGPSHGPAAGTSQTDPAAATSQTVPAAATSQIGPAPYRDLRKAWRDGPAKAAGRPSARGPRCPAPARPVPALQTTDRVIYHRTGQALAASPLASASVLD